MLSKQLGIVRTNCLDCLDRTNVTKMKVCLKAFNDFVWNKGANDKISRLGSPDSEHKREIERTIVCMWAVAGDLISKVYCGTESTLTAVTLKGHEDFSDHVGRYMTSARRFVNQKFTDEFKQECILILQGMHSSSVTKSMIYAK